MSDYNEYTRTELSLTKTTWAWFPCRLEVGGKICYSNGHILTDKSPVRNFPAEAPNTWALQGKRREAFIKPYDASCVFQAFYAAVQPVLELKAFRRRYAQIGRDGYRPGIVYFERSDGKQVLIGRHYYAFVSKMYKGKNIEFRQGGDPLSIVQVVVSGKPVGVIMPLRF